MKYHFGDAYQYKDWDNKYEAITKISGSPSVGALLCKGEIKIFITRFRPVVLNVSKGVSILIIYD